MADTTAGAVNMTDDEAEARLQELLAGLDDEDLHELAALAEAMHAEGTGS